MNRIQLEIGDIIAVNRLGYKHVGVYVGSRPFSDQCVIHNAKSNGVILSNLAEFSAGAEVFIHQKATGNYFERQAIATRALALLGQKYDLLQFNCEHAANLAQRGVAESPQIVGLAVVSLIACGIAVLSAKKAQFLAS